jgi:hypothetical protein
MESKVEAAAGLVGIKGEFVRERVLVRPVRGVSVPVDGESRLRDIEGVQDERGAAEVVG